MATRIVRYLCDFCEEEFHYECEAAEHEEICPFRMLRARCEALIRLVEAYDAWDQERYSDPGNQSAWNKLQAVRRDLEDVCEK